MRDGYTDTDCHINTTMDVRPQIRKFVDIKEERADRPKTSLTGFNNSIQNDSF